MHEMAQRSTGTGTGRNLNAIYAVNKDIRNVQTPNLAFGAERAENHTTDLNDSTRILANERAGYYRSIVNPGLNALANSSLAHITKEPGKNYVISNMSPNTSNVLGSYASTKSSLQPMQSTSMNR